MFASGLGGDGSMPENRGSPRGTNLARFVRKGRQRQSCRAFGRSVMDKFESFVFSVALVAAGLITLVTLPLA